MGDSVPSGTCTHPWQSRGVRTAADVAVPPRRLRVGPAVLPRSRAGSGGTVSVLSPVGNGRLGSRSEWSRVSPWTPVSLSCHCHSS